MEWTGKALQSLKIVPTAMICENSLFDSLCELNYSFQQNSDSSQTMW